MLLGCRGGPSTRSLFALKLASPVHSYKRESAHPAPSLATRAPVLHLMKLFSNWSWLYRSLFLANMFTVHAVLESARTARPEPVSTFRAHGRAAIRWCVCGRCTAIGIRILNVLHAWCSEKVRRIGCAFGLWCSCCVIGIGTADEEAPKKYLRAKGS